MLAASEFFFSTQAGCLTVAVSCISFACNVSKVLQRGGDIHDSDDDDADGDDGGVDVDVDGKDDTDGNCIGNCFLLQNGSSGYSTY